MSRLVMIDSQIFIWGVKGQSVPEQQGNIAYAKEFIKSLDENRDKILIPTPLLTEVLSPVPKQDQQQILNLIDKKFQIAPFDKMAAMKCAELINLSLTKEETIKYRAEHKVTKNKLKFDCMLVAIAIIRGVEIIYAEDPDLLKFAHDQITVETMPRIAIQATLDLSVALPEKPDAIIENPTEVESVASNILDNEFDKKGDAGQISTVKTEINKDDQDGNSKQSPDGVSAKEKFVDDIKTLQQTVKPAEATEPVIEPDKNLPDAETKK